MANYSFLFKYIIIGDSGVGKSCFMIQFADRRFKNEHDLTIGVEFGAKTISIENKNIKIQIWDTAGQESFKSVTRSYYRGAVAALLLYDISSRESFENLAGWIKEATNHANKNVTILLIGNKADLQERAVTTEEAQQFAAQHNMTFLEASAKDGHNVDEAFFSSAKIIITKIENGEYDLTNENTGIKVGRSYPISSLVGAKKTRSCSC